MRIGVLSLQGDFREHLQVLRKLGVEGVMVQQGNILGSNFHPELTDDTKIHEYFINLIGRC
jgi:5'-phosphate synthase pdxT subunit